LKNALEWTVSTPVFYNKPVALITASGLGEKAHESLLLIMQTLQAKIGVHASLLIQGASSKVNKQAEITDPATLTDIGSLISSFLETMNESIAADSPP
jgi:NAD(P)H-dependent FMN reductase